MKAATENDVLKACLQLLALRGVFAWRCNNIPAPLPNGKGFRRFVGRKGCSDIVGILKRPVYAPLDNEMKPAYGLVARDFPPVQDDGDNLRFFGPQDAGFFIGVEVKKPGGRVSPDQKDFGQRVQAAGGLYRVVSDVKDLDEWLTSLGV